MIRGILLHSSMASTVDGVPLGLLNQKIWTRDIANYRSIRRQGKNYTRIPIEEKESFRWLGGVVRATELVEDKSRLVRVCDRAGDIFELFELCEDLGTNFCDPRFT